MKFIEVITLGRRAFVNIEYIESVISVGDKTHIHPVGTEEYYVVNDSLDEVMKKIFLADKESGE